MDRLNRFVAQIYGYGVCLITVIVMLISIKGIIDAAFDLSDPVRAHGGAFGRTGRPLTNFELYKMEARRDAVRPPRSGPDGSGVVVDTVSSDADLRRMYEAEREAQIGSTKFQATRSLFSGLLFIILAAVLFFIHWRWLKGITTAPSTP